MEEGRPRASTHHGKGGQGIQGGTAHRIHLYLPKLREAGSFRVAVLVLLVRKSKIRPGDVVALVIGCQRRLSHDWPFAACSFVLLFFLSADPLLISLGKKLKNDGI